MKAKTPLWLLLRQEIGLGDWAVGVTMIVFICVGVFLMLAGRMETGGNMAAMFEAGNLPIVASLYLSALTLFIAIAAVPAVAPAFAGLLSLPGEGAFQTLPAFEFLFTRAIDRRIIFRARSAALLIMLIAPLFLSLLMLPFVSEISFAPRNADSPAAVRRLENYQAVFPGSRPRMVEGVAVPGQIVIPHGAEAYTAWLAWSATLTLLLLLGYNLLIARHVQSRRWRAALIPFAPILVLLLLPVLGLRATRFNLYEESFLFFCDHWVSMVLALVGLVWLIQTWCERRFSRLEIL